MAPETSQRIVIPDKGIEIPEEIVAEIVEQHGITRDQIAKVPIGLGRGVPPFTNEELINTADLLYLGQRQRGEAGFPTYAGERHPDVDEANAFRGDRQYINLAIGILRDEYGLEITPNQLLTITGGGQRLVKGILEYFIRDEKREIVTTARTFDRTNRLLVRYLDGKKPCYVQETSDGDIDLESVRAFYETIKGTLFLVTPGSNPDGKTIPIETLKSICELAQNHGGTVVIDGAYARLHHREDDQINLSQLQEYFDDGTLSMVFTATKEGGKRSTAFAVGSEEFMGALLPLVSDESLSPDYDRQREQVIAESLSAKDLAELGYDDVPTFQEFLRLKVRPHLGQNFAIVKDILVEDAGMRLSNEEVDCGYNVAVLLPKDDRAIISAEQFFTKLRTLGVNTPDLTNFSVKLPVEPGFRIPFGGFSAEECKIFCTLIARAYKEVYEA